MKHGFLYSMLALAMAAASGIALAEGDSSSSAGGTSMSSTRDTDRALTTTSPSQNEPAMDTPSGGQSSSNISAQGRANTNGPNSLDRDKGLDRAADRAAPQAGLCACPDATAGTTSSVSPGGSAAAGTRRSGHERQRVGRRKRGHRHLRMS